MRTDGDDLEKKDKKKKKEKSGKYKIDGQNVNGS